METMKDRLRVMLGDERLSRLEDARVLVFCLLYTSDAADD